MVSSADAVPPLFIRCSMSVDPDSAPQNTIFNPLRFIASHVAAL